MTQLIKETEEYFKNDGADSQDFLNTLGWHSLQYYQICDNFKKLLYVNTNSIIIYDSLSGIPEFNKHFKILNGPNWTDNLTNNCFKLRSI